VKYIFRPLVNSIARGFNKVGLQNPNVVTLLMFFFACVSSVFLIFLENLFFFAIFVFFTGILDGVDGSLSRLNNRQTKKGGFLDSTMDRLSEFIIFLGLFLFLYDELLWNLIDMKLIIFISFTATFLISYSRSRADNFFKGDFDVGLMARSERLLYLVITSIIASFWGYMSEFIFIYMWLVIFTAFFRFLKIHSQIKHFDKIKLPTTEN